jgi:site-specific recombinase XerD
MIEDMQLRGLSPSTQESYVRSMTYLARHYRKPPDRITEEELRRYFLFRFNESKWSRTTCTIALCGIKFFYTQVLKRDWTVLHFIRPKPENKLPRVLSREEVRRVLKAVPVERHRVCLATIYSLGLRLGEGTHLAIGDIDIERMFVHIRNAKGDKERYVPLPKRTLELLLSFYRTHNNPRFIFPAPGRGEANMSNARRPLPHNSIQIPFKEACQRAGILKNVSVHHLRHSYAVHLIEAGVNLRYVQQYLGHSDPRTTVIYTRLINPSHQDPIHALNAIMNDL